MHYVYEDQKVAFTFAGMVNAWHDEVIRHYPDGQDDLTLGESLDAWIDAERENGGMVVRELAPAGFRVI